MLVIALVLTSFRHSGPASIRHPVPLLVYHLIDTYPGYGDKALYVTPANFKEQIIYLKTHGYTPLTFEDWSEITHVSKPVFITFDDGYKDNTKMWGIFKQVVSKQFLPKATIFVIGNRFGMPNHLSKTDIQAMASSPFFSIQSHTMTHPNLTQSKNLDIELGQSKQLIEAITHKPVVAISYPFGLFDAKVIKKASTYYKYGVTTLPGFYVRLWLPDENYYLPRIYVNYSTTLTQFSHLLKPDN